MNKFSAIVAGIILCTMTLGGTAFAASPDSHATIPVIAKKGTGDFSFVIQKDTAIKAEVGVLNNNEQLKQVFITNSDETAMIVEEKDVVIVAHVTPTDINTLNAKIASTSGVANITVSKDAIPFDLTLTKQVGNTEEVLTELDREVTFSIGFPTGVRPVEDSMKVVGVHDLPGGAYEIIVTPVEYDSQSNTASFKLKKFSQYALFYTPQESSSSKTTTTTTTTQNSDNKSEDNADTSEESSPKPLLTAGPVIQNPYANIQTGDSPWPTIILIIAVLSGILALVMFFRKKYVISSVVLTIVFTLSSIYFITAMYKGVQEEASYKELRKSVHSTGYTYDKLPDHNKNEDDNDFITENEREWTNVTDNCPDAVAWLTVEGTGIDYPVVKAKYEDASWYLYRDAMGNASSSGAIFMLGEDNLSNPNSFIFGHSMKNGSMFGSLKNLYKNKDFDHEVVIDTPEDGVHKYEIFAMAVVDKTTDLYRVPSKEELPDYIDEIKASSDTFTDYGGGDIITLSTCYGLRGTNKRLLVFCEKQV